MRGMVAARARPRAGRRLAPRGLEATARRQKLTVREYQLESNQNLMFLLDAGA